MTEKGAANQAHRVIVLMASAREFVFLKCNWNRRNRVYGVVFMKTRRASMHLQVFFWRGQVAQQHALKLTDGDGFEDNFAGAAA